MYSYLIFDFFTDGNINCDEFITMLMEKHYLPEAKKSSQKMSQNKRTRM